LKILVTGATGFLGSHAVPWLLANGHEVTVLARNPEKLGAHPWHAHVRAISHDLHGAVESPSYEEFGKPDALLHLAWQGLPNYKAIYHFEENLFASYRFIKRLVSQGLERVAVTGTCLEYGMVNGQLAESMVADPVVPYAIAKHALRKSLAALQCQMPFQLQWTRIFYIYGQGQSPSSLFSQLDSAIAAGKPLFNMSAGEQLRDFLPVELAASYIGQLLSAPQGDGIFNICSGTPVSVRSIVEHRIAARGSVIKPYLGYYPYPDYEPLAFWGDTRKLKTILNRTS
jgi:dTDP-6-deoxy-L-talose 4-dehydrogenase (NAD+)